MKHLGLKAVIRKARAKRESKDLNNPFKDHIKRKFIAKEPDKKWFTDISYIKMRSRTMYFSMIIDGFNNEIISIAISYNNDNKLVMDTLNKCRKRMLASKNLVLHFDRGSQYTSYDYMNMLNVYGITQSTSRRGNSLDNRPAEYFFSILKSEFLYLIPLKDRKDKEVIARMETFINFYNNERPQSTLGWLSPIEYREKYCNNEL